MPTAYPPDTRPPAVFRDGDVLPGGLRGAAVAIGNFDGVHRGHRGLVDTARSLAHPHGRPAAVLTFDPHPRAFFAPDRPHFRLTPEPVKLKVLAASGADLIIVRRFDAALAATSAADFVFGLLRDELGASELVIGGDFHFGRGREGTPAVLSELATEAGLGLTVSGTVEVGGASVSSSRIRDALRAGRVTEANELLGYRWFVSGTVVHGRKLGRTLGYPTANLRLDPGCELAHGIYAVRLATADGVRRDGVASFGRRPTFDDGAPLLEVHVLDFASDLYGQEVEVEFVAWIRAEERFDSADALVVRMRMDEAEARRALRGAPGGRDVSLIGGPTPLYRPAGG